MLISQLDNRGFTLAEVMVSLLITLVGLLGLLTAVDLATKENLKNQQRSEAAQIAEDAIARFRVIPFDQVSTCATCNMTPSPAVYHDYPQLSVNSRLRGVSKSYTVTRRTSNISDNSKDIEVRVNWTYGKESFNHEVATVRSK